MDISEFVERLVDSMTDDHSFSDTVRSDDMPVPGASTIRFEDSDGDEFCVIVLVG